MQAKKSKGGRPIRDPRPGERFPMSFKVTAELKAQIGGAAKASGRTESAEAELRLERSFEKSEMLKEALSLAYGEKLAGLLILIGKEMQSRGRFFMDHTSFDSGPDSWMNNLFAFRLAVESAEQVLKAAHPLLPKETTPRELEQGRWWVNELRPAAFIERRERTISRIKEIEHLLGKETADLMCERISEEAPPPPDKTASLSERESRRLRAEHFSDHEELRAIGFEEAEAASAGSNADILELRQEIARLHLRIDKLDGAAEALPLPFNPVRSGEK